MLNPCAESLQSVLIPIKWVELHGKFEDGQPGKVDLSIEMSSMAVVVHKPHHSELFRETSALILFEKRLVAVKDDQDGICFVQTFNKSHDEMEKRVEEAKQHHFDFGELKLIWVNPRNLAEFEPEAVRLSFGSEIAIFCEGFRVVFLDSKHTWSKKPRGGVSGPRERRGAYNGPPGGWLQIPDHKHLIPK